MPGPVEWLGGAMRCGMIAAALALAAGPAPADELYQAQTIVTGQGEANRTLGFALCLQDVLVKISGDPRLIGDRRVVALGATAGTLVAGFDYHDRMSGIPVHDEQGTRDRPYDLIVRFDPAKIDAALRSLGREPWTTARPRLVVFLAVRNGPTALVLSADGERGRDQRESLMAAASRRGVPVVLPPESALAAAGLTVERLPGTDLSRLDEIAKTLGGDAALAGSLVWVEKSLGWTADWRIARQGATSRWQRRGVTFDDAFRDALAGAAQIMSGHGQPGKRRVGVP
jgi:hypothetical protein